MRWLMCLAAVQGILYAGVAWLSRVFVFGEAYRERPIIAVLVLFAACFALYAASLVVALRCRRSWRLAWMVFLPAVAFRLVMLFSEPIQEIDIYRYLWDGAAAARGVSPFRYPPGDVLAAEATGGSPPDLQRLVRLRDESPAMAEVLRRIHYAELPTVYPPVSQAVFALADLLTPSSASVYARVTTLKGVLLTFDMATILLVWLLVAAAGKHPAWVVAYAWCPLVMKEFAGSGHLDTIAVCLTTASIWCAVRAYVASPRPTWRWQMAAAALLGLSIGAKLYAIVLLPLLAAMAGRRDGMRRAVAFVVVGLAISAGALAPMLLVRADAPGNVAAPLAGVGTFLSRWEMNDFLFMILVENLYPDAAQRNPTPWFSVVPGSWPAAAVMPLADALSIDARRAAFLLARAATASVFAAIALGLVGWAFRKDALCAFLQAAFLTLAWFWLLAPTQNPWYWTWTLPLLPFVRGRAWFAVSGLVFVYYLRFWLLYHWPDARVLGTRYGGAAFFDFVVTWLEYGPWFAWLAGAFLARRSAASPDGDAARSPTVTRFTDPSPVQG